LKERQGTQIEIRKRVIHLEKDYDQLTEISRQRGAQSHGGPVSLAGDLRATW